MSSEENEFKLTELSVMPYISMTYKSLVSQEKRGDG